MSFVDNYCDTLVRKLKFEKFVKKHRFGKDFCEEYKRYCLVHTIEPRININSILDIPIELERDTSSNERNRYNKINENRFFNHNGDLNVEYESFSKLYDALKNYGTPTRDYKELFIYRFSGIYQKGTPMEQIEQKYRSENKMEWNWKIKQTLPVVIRLLFQEGKSDRIPYKAIASYFGIEDTNGFSSLCKSVGQNSLESIRAMLTNCGFKDFEDIVQEIKEEKKTKKTERKNIHE